MYASIVTALTTKYSTSVTRLAAVSGPILPAGGKDGDEFIRAALSGGKDGDEFIRAGLLVSAGGGKDGDEFIG